MVIHDNSRYYRDSRLLPIRVLATCLLATSIVCLTGFGFSTRLQVNAAKPSTVQASRGIEADAIQHNKAFTTLSNRPRFEKANGA